ncbi:MAG: hypothetical protein KDD43_00470 [Bdellovibrionales bacterium]|nr:hypothetical protein [Bdellovibrionales bacterium]
MADNQRLPKVIDFAIDEWQKGKRWFSRLNRGMLIGAWFKIDSLAELRKLVMTEIDFVQVYDPDDYIHGLAKLKEEKEVEEVETKTNESGELVGPWTKEENQRLRDNIHLDILDICQLFPNRSPKGVKLKWGKLRKKLNREKGKPVGEVKKCEIHGCYLETGVSGLYFCSKCKEEERLKHKPAFATNPWPTPERLHAEHYREKLKLEGKNEAYREVIKMLIGALVIELK